MTIPHHGRIIPWEPRALGEGRSTQSQVSILLEMQSFGWGRCSTRPRSNLAAAFPLKA